MLPALSTYCCKHCGFTVEFLVVAFPPEQPKTPAQPEGEPQRWSQPGGTSTCGDAWSPHRHPTQPGEQPASHAIPLGAITPAAASAGLQWDMEWSIRPRAGSYHQFLRWPVEEQLLKEGCQPTSRERRWAGTEGGSLGAGTREAGSGGGSLIKAERGGRAGEERKIVQPDSEREKKHLIPEEGGGTLVTLKPPPSPHLRLT